MNSWYHLGLTALLSGCGRSAQDVPSPPPDVDERAAPAVAVKPALPPESAAPIDCVDELGMIYIPGGEYFDEYTKKTAQISGFWIDRTEVTIAAYRKFVADGFDTPYDKPNTCNWNTPDNDDLPVNCIDWYQAFKFCDWSHKRLPTMSEWGWAAQGREERRAYPWGDTPPSCDLAIVDMDDTDEVAGCGRGRAWPVGSRPGDVTRDGVLDMLGNVAEKTSTGYSENPKSTRYQMGASWANAPGAGPTAQMCYPMVYEAYSDKAGVRCAKDAGPRPPCTRRSG